MKIIFDKKGNAIEAVLSKDEQLILMKKNNQLIREQQNDTNGTSNSHLDSSSKGD